MKYQGSKLRLGKRIAAAIPRHGELWVEPFVGGCGMIRHVAGKRAAADSNRYMVALWRSIRDGWIPPNAVTRDEWKAIRLSPESFDPALVGFVGVGCSYGGRWFHGYAAPVRNRDYIAEAHRAAIKLAPLIQGVKFAFGDYRSLIIPAGSIVYCDPPYKGTKGYAEPFDHDAFWSWVRQQSAAGNRVYVSEYTAPDDFESILDIEKSSTMNAHKTRQTVERLFKWREQRV